MSTSWIEYNDEYFDRVRSYWDQVNESDGFDIEGIRGPPAMYGTGVSGMMSFNCTGPDHPSVKLYARLGLHRYNMKEGTNLELHCLIKYNTRFYGASSFYITLAVRDTVTRGPMHTFQVGLDVMLGNRLDVICSIARVKGETTSERITPHHDSALITNFVLPDWPSDDDAFDDRDRFYLVEGSDLLDTYWIRLYLELVVSANDYSILDEDLSKLKIVKVAIETTEEAPLKAKNSVLYIVFKGLATGGIGEHVERKAIVKSVLSELTGYLYLKGNLCRGEEDLTPLSLEEIIIQNREIWIRNRRSLRVL